MIEVYTDGSGTSMDKAGGWGFVIIIDGEKVHEDNGHLEKATNNVAELTAAVMGLEYVDQNLNTNDEIVLVSDSQLVLGYANGSFKIKALHLTQLYNRLRILYKKLNAETRWVKGHSGDIYNEECDKLAKAARLLKE